ncbi:MAG: 3-deoxy-8-phosphooctulonate synthase, partial [Flammeovirgaceae bacterium]|nr:3-deoxy-8-phosphooctulonate synthase [Flammeovirgaceae bacterium]MDW8287449.1 3-deoxy-8-phosphooctulonate synthase [Flammeovirgaceae bacterium]
MTLYEQLKTRPFVIAGHCVIESESSLLDIAERLKKLMAELDLLFIFKASFDKANRTSVNSYRGPGMEEGLRILEKVKKELDVYLTTDIHETYQAVPTAEVVDIIQIPAFLCRQTDLVVAAGKTGKIVNIKKAQ